MKDLAKEVRRLREEVTRLRNVNILLRENLQVRGITDIMSRQRIALLKQDQHYSDCANLLDGVE